MLYCNCSFLIEKWSFNKWMALPGVAKLTQYHERRDDCKCLFERNSSFEKSKSLQVTY